MAVAARRGSKGVLGVGGHPFITMVADEGRGVFHAGDSEVGLSWTDEGGHAGQGTRGDPEN